MNYSLIPLTVQETAAIASMVNDHADTLRRAVIAAWTIMTPQVNLDADGPGFRSSVRWMFFGAPEYISLLLPPYKVQSEVEYYTLLLTALEGIRMVQMLQNDIMLHEMESGEQTVEAHSLLRTTIFNHIEAWLKGR